MADVLREPVREGNARARPRDGAARAVRGAERERREQENGREGLVEGRAHQKLK